MKKNFLTPLIAYKVTLVPEPNNPNDPEAISVKLILESGAFIHIGYVAAELTQHIKPYKHRTKSFISSVRFRSTFQREGYYAILNLVKNGPWPKKVVAAGRGGS